MPTINRLKIWLSNMFGKQFPWSQNDLIEHKYIPYTCLLAFSYITTESTHKNMKLTVAALLALLSVAAARISKCI